MHRMLKIIHSLFCIASSQKSYFCQPLLENPSVERSIYRLDVNFKGGTPFQLVSETINSDKLSLHINLDHNASAIKHTLQISPKSFGDSKVFLTESVCEAQNISCFANECHILKLHCRKGHRWNAVQGSEMCKSCPYCKVPGTGKRKNRAEKSPNTATNVSFSDSVYAYVRSNSGETISFNSNTSLMRSSAKVRIRCGRGHEWETQAYHLIRRRSWCPVCKREKQMLSDVELHLTAKHYNGTYLGLKTSSRSLLSLLNKNSSISDTFASQSSPRTLLPYYNLTALLHGDGYQARSSIDRCNRVAQQIHLWQCAKGHIFEQRPNNIRRPPGSKRVSSWCPECRKSGMHFQWLDTGKCRQSRSLRVRNMVTAVT